MSSASGVKVCEMCGSENIVLSAKSVSLGIAHGPAAVYQKVVTSCRDCGEVCDVTANVDRSKAIAEAERASLESMIEFVVAETGYSLANLERALDLPPRTISRWKSGKEPSAAGLTLLRFVRTFPWLITVAENNYEESHARKALVHAALDVIDLLRRSIPDIDQLTYVNQKTETSRGESYNGFFSGRFDPIPYPAQENMASSEVSTDSNLLTFISEPQEAIA